MFPILFIHQSCFSRCKLFCFRKHSKLVQETFSSSQIEAKRVWKAVSILVLRLIHMMELKMGVDSIYSATFTSDIVCWKFVMSWMDERKDEKPPGKSNFGCIPPDMTDDEVHSNGVEENLRSIKKLFVEILHELFFCSSPARKQRGRLSSIDHPFIVLHKKCSTHGGGDARNHR